MTEICDPRDILYRDYPNTLSDSAYKVLMRLIYASSQSDEMEFPDLSTLNKRLHVDAIYSDSTWLELAEKDFITVRESKNRTSYRLNAEKITRDCGEVDVGELKITIGSRINGQSFSDVELDDALVEFNLKQRFKEDFDLQLATIVSEAIRKMVSYYTQADKTFSIVEFKRLINHLSIYNASTVKEACTIYNEDEEMHTTKGWKWLLAVAKNVDARVGKSKRTKFARSGYTIVGGREAKKTTQTSTENVKMKDESNDKFALKLVTGNVETSRVYKKLLEEDHESLNVLWNRGYSILKSQNELQQAYFDYDWLKKKRVAGHNVR